MTTDHEQLRISVSEAMGWRDIAMQKYSLDHNDETLMGTDHEQLYTRHLPELTHDYLAECRKTLTPGERVDYVEHLRNIVGPHGSATIWDYIDASEEQQALAFLHAKGFTL